MKSEKKDKIEGLTSHIVAYFGLDLDKKSVKAVKKTAEKLFERFEKIKKENEKEAVKQIAKQLAKEAKEAKNLAKSVKKDAATVDSGKKEAMVVAKPTSKRGRPTGTTVAKKPVAKKPRTGAKPGRKPKIAVLETPAVEAAEQLFKKD